MTALTQSMISGLPEPFTIETNTSPETRANNWFVPTPFYDIPLRWIHQTADGWASDTEGPLTSEIMYWRFMDIPHDLEGYEVKGQAYRRRNQSIFEFATAGSSITWDGETLTYQLTCNFSHHGKPVADWNDWKLTCTPVTDARTVRWMDRVHLVQGYPTNYALIMRLPLEVSALAEVSHRNFFSEGARAWDPHTIHPDEFKDRIDMLTPEQSDMLIGLAPEWEDSASSLLRAVTRI